MSTGGRIWCMRGIRGGGRETPRVYCRFAFRQCGESGKGGEGGEGSILSMDANHFKTDAPPNAWCHTGKNIEQARKRTISQECPLFWTLLRPPILRLT